jgi:hypothetical protein
MENNGFSAGDDILIPINPKFVTWVDKEVQEVKEKRDNKTLENIQAQVEFPDKIRYNLDQNQVHLGSPFCGLYISCDEIKIDDMFVVLILSMDHGRQFDLYPGSRFRVSYSDVTGESRSCEVYFSGIIFEHQEKMFMVFHKEK